MFKLSGRRMMVFTTTVLVACAFAAVAYANHSWGNYHWARTANPFTVKLGDNVSNAWDSYLGEASADWTQSTVLDAPVVPGNTGGARRCPATAGMVEVCNDKYGNNGWLGIAQIWASGSHITQGTVKMNDTYFNSAQYNTPAWRRLVMCQEVGHTFGLDHQDETFDNPNLGTCMDYTNDPDGGAGGASPNDPSNEHPNKHDYDQLLAIYNHTDSTNTTMGFDVGGGSGAGQAHAADAAEWGRLIRSTNGGRTSLFENDLGNGQRIFTFVIWADGESRGPEDHH